MKKLPLLVKLFSVLSLFIIVPVVIVSIVTNFGILHYAQNEISRSGIGKLKVAQSLTELLAGQISKETLRLSLNADLNELYQVPRYRPALTNLNQLSVISRALGSVSEMVKTNSCYQSVYIYLDHADYILASSFNEPETVIRKEDYQDTGWLKYYQNYQKQRTRLSWLKTRIPKYNHTYIPGNLRHNRNETLYNYVITYVYPLTPYTTKLQGAIVINLYENALCKLINSNNPDNSDGYIFIMNQRGEVFSHVDKNLVSQNIHKQKYVQKILQSQPAEGNLLTKLGQKRYLVTYLKTEFNGWIYVGVFPLDPLMGMATGIRKRTLVIAMVLVISAVALSLVISRKIFAPLQQLINLIKNRKEVTPPADGNELTLISQAFDSMIQKDDQLTDTLVKSQHNLREHYLLKLLRGESDPALEETILQDGLGDGYYLCVLMVIDRYREFQQKYDGERRYSIKVSLLTTAEEFFAGYFKCAGLILERERMVILLNSPDHPSHLLAQMNELWLKLKEELHQVCDNPVSLGMSRVHAGQTEIKDAYHEAQEAIKQKLTAGYGRVLWQPPTTANLKYYYPLALEKHLFNHLELGQVRQASETVAEMVHVIQERPDLSYDNIIQIFNQLLGKTVQYLLESHIQISDLFGDNFNLYHQLACQETLADIQLWFQNLYTRIFEFQEQRADNTKNHLTRILEYLHQNYRQDIDINTLADHIGLSYSHVRKIFHDAMGENIVSYINNLRIDEAKRLLCQTRMSINEVALSLGYNNSQSFNRFFKKYEGITPGEFRNKKPSKATDNQLLQRG